MNTRRKVFIGALAAVVLAMPVALVALWAAPPDIIRVGANYAAKIVCSNVFLANRDPLRVLAVDVQAPGHPLLRWMKVDVDREAGVVRAGLFGFIGNGLAAARPRVGCTAVPDGHVDRARAGRASFAPVRGSPVIYQSFTSPELQRVIDDEKLAGVGMRAIVIVHQGVVVAERYSDGFDSQTPQLGWSMTKSVTAGLIGLLVKDGRIALDQSAGWRPEDPRARITIADLLSMSSGLEFNESYGMVSDVTRMLYLEPDMARFVRSKPQVRPVGATWNYSSGTAVLLSRLFEDALGGDAVAYVQSRLFAPLGIRTAVIETDVAGTLVGSSYMYATPREWARYGQLLVQDGLWEGQEILPKGYVAMMASPAAASGGEYGRGMVWRWASHSDQPGVNPDAAFGIPSDTFWMAGHDGQYVAVIPSRQTVIVRMGLTPAREHYQPQPLVQAVLAAVP